MHTVYILKTNGVRLTGDFRSRFWL